MSSKIELAKIRALTFYQDTLTKARRADPIQQLTCRGSACKLYQPEVVRCQNIGGYGTEVDWKCEADLPESLRFGKVEVSCEGWSGPGDPYVLKGSCGLQYRLVQVDDKLRDSSSPVFPSKDIDWPAVIFKILWFGILAFIVISFLRSCLGSRNGQSNNNNGGGGPQRPRGPYTSGPGSYDPPPPYSDNSSDKPQPGPSNGGGWSSLRPGFWSGLALGGLGTQAYNNLRNRRDQQREYDWERDRARPRPVWPDPRSRPLWGGGSRSGSLFSQDSDDRGEGSSNLGSMRSASGFGGSNVR